MSIPIFKDFDKAANGEQSRKLDLTSSTLLDKNYYWLYPTLKTEILIWISINLPDIFSEDFDSKYTLKVKTSAPADTVSL